jgi:hypothetical protein
MVGDSAIIKLSIQDKPNLATNQQNNNIKLLLWILR